MLVIAPASTTSHFTGGAAPSTRPRTSARKAACVGVEEVRPELKDHEAGSADRTGHRWYRLPLSACLDQHGRVRSIAVAHVPEQRQHYRQHDALLDADRDHRRGGDQRQPELARALAPNVAQAAHVDEADGDREHDGTEHALRAGTAAGRSGRGARAPRRRRWRGGRSGCARRSVRPSPSASGCRSRRTCRSARRPRWPPTGRRGRCSRRASGDGASRRRAPSPRSGRRSSGNTKPPTGSSARNLRQRHIRKPNGGRPAGTPWMSAMP